MKKRAFTLIEIIIVIVIIGILATVGLPFYQNVLESSKEQVCQTNLFALKKAVEMYTMEHDTVPGSLSELKPETINKAYASVMSGKDAWKKRLAYLIVEGPQWGKAYAASFGMPKLRCPSNPDTSSTQVSYGLNSGLAGMTALQYKSLGNDTVVIADAGAEVFSYSGCNFLGSITYAGDKQPVPFSQIIDVRAHKKYKILSPAGSYLKGVDKSGQSGRITASEWIPDTGNQKPPTITTVPRYGT